MRMTVPPRDRCGQCGFYRDRDELKRVDGLPMCPTCRSTQGEPVIAEEPRHG